MRLLWTLCIWSHLDSSSHLEHLSCAPLYLHTSTQLYTPVNTSAVHLDTCRHLELSYTYLHLSCVPLHLDTSRYFLTPLNTSAVHLCIWTHLDTCGQLWTSQLDTSVSEHLLTPVTTLTSQLDTFVSEHLLTPTDNSWTSQLGTSCVHHLLTPVDNSEHFNWILLCLNTSWHLWTTLKSGYLCVWTLLDTYEQLWTSQLDTSVSEHLLTLYRQLLTS